MENSGFVAGTLVHTDKGLVPIEQLKVGDLVLSRDENNPNGELAYKKVVKTFVSDKKEMIVRVAYSKDEKQLRKILKENPEQYDTGNYYLYCTKGHPFWVTNTYSNGWDEPYIKGYWKPATQTEGRLHSFDGSEFISEGIDYYTPLVKTNLEHIAVQANLYRDIRGLRPDGFLEDDDREELYGLIDFSSGKPVLLDTGTRRINDWAKDQDIKQITLQKWYDMDPIVIWPEELCPVERIYRDEFFKDDLYEEGFAEEAFYQAYVYNIEVEDYHTYFVGKHGIWVHDYSN